MSKIHINPLLYVTGILLLGCFFIQSKNIPQASGKESGLVPINIIYVDQSVVDGDGSSWAMALSDLNQAIMVAQVCDADTILVAEGSYFPTAGTDRNASFSILDSVIIIGGYPSGGGPQNFDCHPTILSGDIGVQSNNSDNSYHVVSSVNGNPTMESTLQGLIIEEGNANGSGMDQNGGGVLLLSTGLLNLVDVVIRKNRANQEGGAIWSDSNLELLNCLLHNNDGANYLDNNGVAFIVNTTSANNGVMTVGIDNDMSFGLLTIANSILYNTQITMEVANPTSVMNTTTIDPLFVNIGLNNFRLLAGSPAINAGDNTSAMTFGLVEDLDGFPRIILGTVDAGAYEFPFSCVPGVKDTVYLNANGIGKLPVDSLIENIPSHSLLDIDGTPYGLTDSLTYGCGQVGIVMDTLSLINPVCTLSLYQVIKDVVVLDSIPPIVICQNITIQLDQGGNTNIVSADVDGGSTDACGIANMTISNGLFTCVDTGVNMVTLVVTDQAGNKDSCIAIVTVEDTIPPTALCQDLTVQLDVTGSGMISASQVNNGSTDNCTIASITLNDSLFDCSDVGTQIVTLTVSDVNGNVDSCMAMITVVDTVAPIALCQNVTIYLDAAGNASVTGEDVDNGSSDACGIASLMVSPSSFTCSDVGMNGVVLTVTDSNNNVDVCPAMVEVVDTIAPLALCKDITVHLDANGNATLKTSDIDAGSSDACGILSISIPPTDFTCVDTGLNLVVLTVLDSFFNVASCTASVTVIGFPFGSGPVIVGMSPMCPGLQNVPYDVVPVPGAISYQWSYSGIGATILNNGFPSIEINFATNATAGILSVQYISVCGPSGVRDNFSVVKGSEFSCFLANSCEIVDLIVLDIMISFPGAINLFKASNAIISAATIEDAETVLFRAGNQIDLLPNFEVEHGAIFSAEIEGCFDNIQPEIIRKEE